MKTVDIIIPTYKPNKDLVDLINMALKQSMEINRIILINTNKNYWNRDIEKLSEKIEVYHIREEDFDHGKTRNFGVEKSKADYFVMMTQDAVLYNTKSIENIVRPLMNNENIAMCYGRQIPRKDCKEIEKLTRDFNYPPQSKEKSKSDEKIMGIKAYFASDVFCGYNHRIFQKLGGFVNKTIFNEDMLFGIKALNSGYSIYYSAEAKVIHSHNYTYLQQLRRNFDLGVSQSQYREEFSRIKAEKEGFAMVKNTAKELIKRKKMYLIPNLIIISGFKLIGYKLGKKYSKLNKSLVKKLSMNNNYWKNI